MKEKVVLAGDIGGTKTALGIFKESTGPRKPIVEETFRSASFTCLEEIAKTFLSRAGGGLAVENACFGVAGIVIDGHVKVTNLPWTLDAQSICKSLGLSSVRLLNDLEAVANAVPILEAGDYCVLNDKPKVPCGTMGVLAPGTGLGEAFLVWGGTTYRAYPSEGGHCSFAPRNMMEVELLRFLLERHEHVSYERVCSGKGIPNLYAFYKEKIRMEEHPLVAEELAAAADPTPVIVRAAMDTERPSPLCRQVVETFVSILGAEAGNLALKVLATGGIYLGGGIPPRIIPFLQTGGFMRTFQHKGRFGTSVAQMPVYVILNPKAAMMGAARAGFLGGIGYCALNSEPF